MRWQVEGVLLFLSHIDSLTSRIKKIDMEVNLLPRNGAVIFNRPNHPNSRIGLRFAENNLTIRNCDLTFVALVVHASVKDPRKDDKSHNHRETDNDYGEGRMEQHYR